MRPSCGCGVQKFRIGQVTAGKAKHGQELVNVDPIGGAVVPRQARFDFFTRQGKTLDQAQAAIDVAQAAAAILDVPRDHFRSERRTLLDVVAEHPASTSAPVVSML